MGMTYRFNKGKYNELLSAGNADDLFTAIDKYPRIGDDLDREDFIYTLLGTAEKSLMTDKERELAEFIRPYLLDADMVIVSKAMVENAIRTLDELDAKVHSMPFDRSLVEDKDSPCCVGIMDMLYSGTSGHKYVEPLISDRQVGSHGTYVLYGPSKEYVDIYKEVCKVYGQRAYHYQFPWETDNGADGSNEVKNQLKLVLSEMEKDDDSFVYVLRRF